MAKIHRFIVDLDIKKEEHLITDPELVKQIGKVLKLLPGEKVVISSGVGSEAVCEIAKVEKGEVGLVGCVRRENKTEPKHPVVLCLAILKKDNFELAIQKAVEVGATEIVPVVTARTVKLGLAHSRLQKILKEAAEQSGRAVVPHLEEPISFADALFRANRKGTVIFCDTSEGAKSVAEVKPKGASYIFIGPEGGWSDEEREAAAENDAVFVHLAPTVLRAETAAILATYLFTDYAQNQ